MGGGGGGQGVVSARYKRFCNNIIERRHHQRVWCSGASYLQQRTTSDEHECWVGWGQTYVFSRVGSKQTAVFDFFISNELKC